MMEMIKIKCPDINMPKSERINFIIEQEFRKWITAPILGNLIRIFQPDFIIDENGTTTEIIEKVKQFVETHWDYRKKQKEATTKEGEAARWLLKSEEIVEDNAELIIECAKTLGLIGNEESDLDEINFLLPLGGARMSNLRRCELARKIIDKNFLSKVDVVALSGMRPLAESEMTGSIETYAPGAKYEFEAISTGLEIAFGCGKGYTEEKNDDTNPNSNYVIRKYNKQYNANNIYSVAAPSTAPELRRANSADCFKFFFEKFEVAQGAKLLNCTSQIYCSYQQVRALFFAVEHNLIFDTIGFPFELNNPSQSINIGQLSRPVNYLQEFKSTVDAMYDFVCEFKS